MSITLPLKKMSAEEKIQVMESIWVDLCDTAGSTLSPDWHGKVLADRKVAALAGENDVAFDGRQPLNHTDTVDLVGGPI